MSDEMTFDELEDTIVDYARDYDRAEHLRDTKWPDMEKAIAAHDPKVQAEQRETDAQIVESEFVRRSYSVKADAAYAIRAVPANTNTEEA